MKSFLFLSGNDKPVYDLRKKQSSRQSLEFFCCKYFHIICVTILIFLVIIFCIVCYMIVGVSAVDSGAYYYHMV